MAKILQLTDNSWVFRTTDSNSGLLFRTDEGYMFLGPKTRHTYASLEELEKKFGGYPTKHSPVTQTQASPPTYVKDGGKTEFVAGYWGLLFAQGWTQAFCPKAATIQTYEHVGPFKNRLEMINHLSTLNTNANLKKL
jgi:hypothetical protein